ncbi:DNA polymerase-3 subunit gamma/tau [Caminicella sporogenes DSM 14501]|uniref:DNA-directed DNA polymerase n=1 Tax=Caminicella sporogenes DSM 14501 TaxID=1121266 RepID=A0A1M6SA48_9FIRM|nr:DNA polymerase III subunit gamma/tau [Caminicella sporogenes]RKD26930.1 DNA polymerase III subunit gamma/tau [Caminicella sporogenes]SHK41653.1 DNA polymerase-3 subunit gamma/tau [Caminicella sporogenes DSM 14501]
MAYTALYRKWRPKIFEEVVGQEHITMTLKNQIKNKNIAHAYLFCGTRGTGKTSTAKIFARAINCLNPQNNNPCNECELCRGILDEKIMDVIEIDAASNNGVDNIRELRENIKYPPSKTKYKVYIVDEVHMLSQGAFNALLKTLEEPPEYVIFILATTEPQKIPATILSRCQRFDFKRVTYEKIFDRLKYICNNSEIEIEDKALKLIIKNSDGAVRDALSILDQCISFAEGKLTYNKVVQILGLVTDEFLFKLTEAICDEDSKTSMKLIDELVSSGKDINQFIKDLINHYRNLMMIKISAENIEEVIDMSRENIEILKKQGERLDINTIIRTINVLSETQQQVKWSSQPRILLELAVIKLIQPRIDDSYEGLIDRIKKLEKKIENLKIEGIKPIKSQSKNIREDKTDVSKEKKEKKVERKETAVLQKLDFKKISSKWNEILKEIKRRKISTYALVMEGKLVALDGNKLIISFKEGFWFHKDATNKANNSEIIEKTILDMTGQSVKIKCVMENELEEINKTQDEMAFTQIEEEVKMVEEFFEEFKDKLKIEE